MEWPSSHISYVLFNKCIPALQEVIISRGSYVFTTQRRDSCNSTEHPPMDRILSLPPIDITTVGKIVDWFDMFEKHAEKYQLTRDDACAILLRCLPTVLCAEIIAIFNTCPFMSVISLTLAVTHLVFAPEMLLFACLDIVRAFNDARIMINSFDCIVLLNLPTIFTNLDKSIRASSLAFAVNSIQNFFRIMPSQLYAPTYYSSSMSLYYEVLQVRLIQFHLSFPYKEIHFVTSNEEAQSTMTPEDENNNNE